jgi:hypothetical protein
VEDGAVDAEMAPLRADRELEAEINRAPRTMGDARPEEPARKRAMIG